MLLTKLHLPAPSINLVHRPELFEILNRGLNRKLVLISAPAGYGKSTLVSDWIHQVKIKAAWVSLDKMDNDPVEFLGYIIMGIQGIAPSFGIGAASLLNTPDKSSSESITSLLINDILAIEHDVVLVLDDFHLIRNREVLGIINMLLEHAPENLHIIISTRSDPSLNLARLRSQQQMLELRSSDLSFSASDIAELYSRKMKIRLSVDDIHTLEAKTEGWIAGLQLAALSLQNLEDPSSFIKSFAGDNRYIMDYLIEEVLNSQVEEVRDFLLKTSILDQISAPLCNEVLNRKESQLILEQIENNNMFLIPLDTTRYWFRYHHLFADLLKQRLLQQDKAVVRELHSRACDWFEKHDMYDQAIGHSLEIKDYKKSVSMLGRELGQMWESGLHTAILNYGKLIPDEYIFENPEFCLYYAWILISSGKLKDAKPYLKNAERIVHKDPGSKQKLQGKIAVAFAYLHSNDIQSDLTFEYCDIAMKNLTEDDPIWLSWAWFSSGMAKFTAGELEESRKALYKALNYGKRSGNIYLMTSIASRLAENEQELGNYTAANKVCTDLLNLLEEKGYSHLSKADWTFAPLYLILATTNFTWADLDAACESVNIAYELSKKSSDIYLKVFILMFFSFLLLLKNDPQWSLRKKELEDLINNHSIPPYLGSMVIGWKVYFMLHMGEVAKARSLIEELGLDRITEINHSNEIEYMAYVRILLTEHRLEEAAKILSELYQNALAGKRVERIIELEILYAALYSLEEDREKAESWLLKAMKRAAKDNILTYFISTSDLTGNLLEEVIKMQATKDTGIPAEFFHKLNTAIKKREEYTKQKVEGVLSEREMDTLKLMAQGLMNQEIADKMFISRNTVKTHVKNILLKLESDNRTDAVSRARDSGIL